MTTHETVFECMFYAVRRATYALLYYLILYCIELYSSSLVFELYTSMITVTKNQISTLGFFSCFFCCLFAVCFCLFLFFSAKGMLRVSIFLETRLSFLRCSRTVSLFFSVQWICACWRAAFFFFFCVFLSCIAFGRSMSWSVGSRYHGIFLCVCDVFFFRSG